MQQSGLPGNAAGFTIDDVHHLMTTAIGLMFARWVGEDTVKVIAEKTPEHIVSLDTLVQLVPNMKIIHVYSDARDEALAVWDFNQNLSQGAFQQKYPRFGDFAKAFADNWSQSINTTRTFERTHRGQCSHFRAEGFQGEEVTALRPLVNFLGVDDSDAVIKNCADAAWEVVPLDVDAGTWKKKFDAETAQHFERQCGELLKLLGYVV